ncbi:MAG: sensor histidine kinase [Actinomycetota bacterium]
MEEARFAEMISKIAHELRSPLTSVKGFSATLLKRWDRFTDEQRQQFVETIHADAERMGRIVSEVLDLARLEAGRLELRCQSVEIGSVARAVVDRLPESDGTRRVRIEIDDSLRAWADADRLTHVIGNLVENGIKFSDSGPVTVRAARTDGGVEIAVADEGVGIAKELQKTIFSGPAPTGQRSGPSGSSLGLYLTRRLVEAHGGSIRVESTPEIGSTFTVTLPENPQP